VTETFDSLARRTICPFAKTAKLWNGPPWNFATSLSENAARHAPDLRQFGKVAKSERYSGYVAEIGTGDATQFAVVKQTFRAYLMSLAALDPDCARVMGGGFEQLDWQFEFGGVRHFLNVFAPCYVQPHSKFIASVDRFYVFFQPEFSFDFCGVNPNSKAIKEKIRTSFGTAQMPYNGAQIDKRIEALLYMFPESPSGGPVRWWEE
jgi:hypothetical protein